MIDPEILAQVRRIQVRTRRLVNDVMVGGYQSSFKGSGIEFDEVREFVEGDDPRAVDWNVTARTGRPHIKKYMEERELTLIFLLDLSASAEFGTVSRGPSRGPRRVREVAAEFCACMSLVAARNNDKAGLIGFSDRIETYVPAKKGSRHVLRLIRDVLAFAPVGKGTDIGLALDHAAKVQRRRAVVFLISDFLGAGDERLLKLLGRRHDLVAVRIRDPRTQTMPRAGLLQLRDLESGQLLRVDSDSRRVREAYAAALAQRDAEFRELLGRAKVDFMELDPELSVATPILKFFRMREQRGAHG